MKKIQSSDIEPGIIYVNRTLWYLVPIVNTFGSEFIKKVNMTSPLAWGVADTKFDLARKTTHRYKIFLLQDPMGAYSEVQMQYIDTKQGRKNWLDFLTFVRGQDYYVADYPYGDLTIKDNHLHGHITVLETPKAYRTSTDNFLNQKFSKMYDKKQFRRVKIKPRIDNGAPNVVWHVLRKSPEYRDRFQDRLNELYNTRVVIEDDVELDSFEIEPRGEYF